MNREKTGNFFQSFGFTFDNYFEEAGLVVKNRPEQTGNQVKLVQISKRHCK
jgi:hypothetical protein